MEQGAAYNLFLQERGTIGDSAAWSNYIARTTGTYIAPQTPSSPSSAPSGEGTGALETRSSYQPQPERIGVPGGTVSMKFGLTGKEGTTVVRDAQGNIVQVSQTGSGGHKVYDSNTGQPMPEQVRQNVVDIETQKSNTERYRQLADYGESFRASLVNRNVPNQKQQQPFNPIVAGQQVPPGFPRINPAATAIEKINRPPDISFYGGYQVGLGGFQPRSYQGKSITPFSQYRTKPISDLFENAAKKYRSFTGRYTPEPQESPVKLGYEKPWRNFLRGVVESPALLSEMVGTTIRGSEFVVREPKLAFSLVPAGLGIMAGGIVKGAKEEPAKTAGQFVGTVGITKGLSTAKLKIGDYIRTAGREEVQASSLIKPEVITGKEMVPMTEPKSTPSDVMKSFYSRKYSLPGEQPGVARAWHTTVTNYVSDTEIKAQAPRHVSDMPGLYGSPSGAGLSPNFLRVAGNQNLGSIFDKNVPLMDRLFGTSEPGTPTVLRITVPAGVKRLPQGIRTDVGASREFMLGGAKKGTLYLTPKLEFNLKTKGMAEAEGVLAPETKLLSSKAKGYYFGLEGRKIPVREYTALSPSLTSELEKHIALTRGGTTLKGITTLKQVEKKFTLGYKPGRTGLITPSKIVGSIGSGLKNLKTSLKGYVKPSGSSSLKYPTLKPYYPRYSKPNYPSYTKYTRPNYPEYSKPNYPNYPGYKKPDYPTYPKYDLYARYPGYPKYPTTPSYPKYPTYPKNPTYTPSKILKPNYPTSVNKALGKTITLKSKAWKIQNPFTTLSDIGKGFKTNLKGIFKKSKR